MADTDIKVGKNTGYLLDLPWTSGQGFPTFDTDPTLDASAWTTKGWLAMPTLIDKVTVKLLEESEEVIPLNAVQRTLDRITMKGLDTISMNFAESDIDAIVKAMNVGAKTTQAAATGQTGYDHIWDGGHITASTYYSLGFQCTSVGGNDFLFFAMKARPIADFSFDLGHEIIKIPTVWKCYQDMTRTAGQQVYRFVELTAAAT